MIINALLHNYITDVFNTSFLYSDSLLMIACIRAYMHIAYTRHSLMLISHCKIRPWHDIING
ncbi:MAG: hypothetical protein QXM92_03120 [Candidatus Anstonellales archaeon]